MGFFLALAILGDWDLIGSQPDAKAWTLIADAGEPAATPSPITWPPKATTPRAKRAILFTASWCGPCQQMKRDTLPALKSKGWKIGATPDNHIQIVDVDADPAAMRRHKITRLPTTVYMEAETELRRVVGFQDPFAIGRLFTPTPQTHTSRWSFPGTTRQDLIDHLNGDGHNYTRRSLGRLTTARLYQLHDSDHEGRRTPTRTNHRTKGTP